MTTTTPPTDLVTVTIDGKEHQFPKGTVLLEACNAVGADVPFFCYHAGLSSPAVCRQCLVDVKGQPKPVPSCYTPVADKMEVMTRSPRALDVRRQMLEFTLVNHPIDCPICDKAGECLLQKQYFDWDAKLARNDGMKVHKAKVVDLGPTIVLDQERCILCTRCTRFLDEVTGTGELGVFQRGDHCSIDLFPERRLDNHYSGNVADICPVGALTNKDFRFRARVWYLDHTPSICTSCATGCNIDIHHRRGEVFRFRPRHNPEVNQYWMCDEGRLSYKRVQGEGRLLQPVVRDGAGWAVRGWPEARTEVVSKLRDALATHGAGAIAGIVSAHATNEEIFLFERLLRDAVGGSLSGLAWSPPDALSDTFLIDADKNPNAAGLRLLTSGAQSVEDLVQQARDGALRVLLLLRADLEPPFGSAILDALGEEIGCVVVLDTHFSSTAEIADVLLPIATFAESDGTFVNRANRVQRVRQAIAPPAQVRAGWQVLSELLADVQGFSVPVDASAVFTEIAAAHTGFRHLSYARLGEQGSPLDQPATAT